MGREFATRVGLTVLFLAALTAAFARSPYEFDFSPIWAFRVRFVKGFLCTIGATALAYVVGLALGVLVAIARLSKNIFIRHIGDFYVEVVRGTPFIVQVAIAWWGIASQIEGVESRFIVGTLALGVFAAAYMGEILRAGIESVERGQFEAAVSLGLDRRQTLQYVVFPQAIKRMIPPMTGELIALTKESSLLFTIGVVEMMSVAKDMKAKDLATLEALIFVAVLYLVITIPLSLLARRLERKLGEGRRSGVDLL